MSWAIENLNAVPFAGLMLVVALGYLLGKPSWRGLTLTPGGATLVVGLVLGHLGLSFAALYGAAPGSPPKMTVGAFGFALFIYAVGFEAGPRFFSTLRGSGFKFVGVAVTLNCLAVGLTVLFARLFSMGDASAAGALAGALTSTPALVSASQVTSNVGLLTISYALTYPVGQVGLLALIAILPKLLRDPLDDESGADEPHEEGEAGSEVELKRAYRVREELAGKTLRGLQIRQRTGCVITRIHRAGQIFLPDADTELAAGDHVYAAGHLDELGRFSDLVGPEVYDKQVREALPSPRRITVLSPKVVGRRLSELQLIGRHGCLVLRVQRLGQWLEPTGSLELERDDVLEVVGRQKSVTTVAEEVGALDLALHETNIAIYALGILAGVLLGSLEVRVLGVDVSLGAAGGLLLAGILLGHFRRIGRFSAQIPRAARQLVRDLGLVLFIGEAGVRGGPHLAAGLTGPVWKTLATGSLVLALSFVATLLVARKVFKLSPLDAWGSLCGAMTSSTALEAVNRAAGHSKATVGYAASYAAATLLVTIGGQVVVMLTR